MGGGEKQAVIWRRRGQRMKTVSTTSRKSLRNDIFRQHGCIGRGGERAKKHGPGSPGEYWHVPRRRSCQVVFHYPGWSSRPLTIGW